MPIHSSSSRNGWCRHLRCRRDVCDVLRLLRRLMRLVVLDGRDSGG
jgi:hypothetical protein